MKRILLTTSLFAFALAMHAQDMASVLREIERNNLALHAAGYENQASDYERRSRNTIGAPSVEYSPFFRKGASGMASSELVVSQEFDFPTLYAARAKADRLQRDAMDKEWLTARRDILLAAKLRCLELIMLSKEHDILKERMDNAGELLALFEKRMNEGDATSLELNKINLETMDLRAELMRNEAATDNARRELIALNANRPLRLDGLLYQEIPSTENLDALRNDILGTDVAIHSAEASVAVSEQDVRVTGQEWMPRLSLGYRRNTEMSEASNGFLVGAAFPVFSSAGRIRAAKARKAAAELSLADTKVRVESETDMLLQEFRRAEASMRIYDLDLMRRSLSLLKKAVSAGSMSLTDYYAEADRIYQKWQAYIAAENSCQRIWATLLKNSL